MVDAVLLCLPDASVVLELLVVMRQLAARVVVVAVLPAAEAEPKSLRAGNALGEVARDRYGSRRCQPEQVGCLRLVGDAEGCDVGVAPVGGQIDVPQDGADL